MKVLAIITFVYYFLTAILYCMDKKIPKNKKIVATVCILPTLIISAYVVGVL